MEFKVYVSILLGGYNGDSFLSSVVKYDPAGDSWTKMNSMEMPEAKSHFCAVMATAVRRSIYCNYILRYSATSMPMLRWAFQSYLFRGYVKNFEILI